jgi:hypothetical protein
MQETFGSEEPERVCVGWFVSNSVGFADEELNLKYDIAFC